jgi:MoxR-like ATPase
LEGRNFVTPDDIKARAEVVLAHRFRISRDVMLKGTAVGPSQIIEEALGKVVPPR